MTLTESHELLVNLGLTGLEAEVFTFLLGESPATGYRVAQALGKPAANTYKAIESLENKGAVLVERGAHRLYRAVPAGELLANMERRFRETREKAAVALAQIAPPSVDDRVYRMKTLRQVMERCRTMLEGAQEVALLDIFPEPLKALRSSLEETSSRGVTVVLKAYRPVEIAGATVAVLPGGDEVIARWPGHWVNVVVDGREHLLAFLSFEGEVYQAIWSNSAYLSWIYHSALGSEIAMAEVQSLVDGKGTLDDIRHSLERFQKVWGSEAPGYQFLRSRFADSDSLRRSKTSDGSKRQKSDTIRRK